MNSGPAETVALRSVRESDVPFLWRMLREAAYWRVPPGGRRPNVAEMLEDPHLSRYVAGWGREGDEGLIAERDGVALGACWLRVFTPVEAGFGFVRPGAPELSIAVAPGQRGTGVGTLLLEAVLAQAAARGINLVSLSVSWDNPARRLYGRAGFQRVGAVSDSWTMAIDPALRRRPAPR